MSYMTNPPERPPPGTLRCVTWNVQGLSPGELRASPHTRAVIRQLKLTGADVLCLQETHIWRCQESRLARLFGKSWTLFFSSIATDRPVGAPQAAAGVLIAVRRPWEGHALSVNDPAGRVCGVQVSHGAATTNIWCIYGCAASWDQRYRFWHNEVPWAELSRVPFTLTGGDFNVLLYPQDRVDGALPAYAQPTADLFRERMEEGKLIDVWQDCGEGAGFTWSRVVQSDEDGITRSGHARLDRWLTHQACASYVSSIAVLPTNLSDHNPLQIDVCPPDYELGPGYWRGSIPAYRHARNAIVGALAMLRRLPARTLDPAQWWADVKRTLRGLVRTAGRELAANRRHELATAEQRMGAASEELQRTALAPESILYQAAIRDWYEARTNLEQVQEADLARLRLRGGTRTLRDYQRPTRLFFARVEARRTKTYIPGLRDVSGTL